MHMLRSSVSPCKIGAKEWPLPLPNAKLVSQAAGYGNTASLFWNCLNRSVSSATVLQIFLKFTP